MRRTESGVKSIKIEWVYFPMRRSAQRGKEAGRIGVKRGRVSCCPYNPSMHSCSPSFLARDGGLIFQFHCQSDSLTTTQAQPGQSTLQAALLERIDQGDQDARARCANRMPDGNRPAVDIQLLHRQMMTLLGQPLQIGEDLCCERLVQFDQINIVYHPPGAFQGHRQGFDRGVK